MVIIRVQVKDRGARKLMKRLLEDLPRTSANEVFNIGRFALKTAKPLIPEDTGKTKRAFMSVIKIKGKNVASAIIGFDKNPHPEKDLWGGKIFILPKWMTFSNKALKHPWRKGDPRFLKITQELVFERFRKRLQIATSRLLKR